MRVLILNSYNKINARLKNEIDTLSQEGYKVKVLLWNRSRYIEQQLTTQEESELNIERINLRAPSNSAKLIFYLPFIYIKLIKKLLHNQYDVLHCCHLGLLPISLVISKIKRKKVVYDSFEFHTISFYENLPNLIKKITPYKFLEYSENIMVYLCDGVLTIDSAKDLLLNRYRKFNPNTQVLYNVPKLNEHSKDKIKEIQSKFKGWRIVSYTGGFNRIKGIDKAIQAVKYCRHKIPNIKFLFIGDYRDTSKDFVDNYIKKKNLDSNVLFLGWMPYREMIHYLCISEVGLALHQPIFRFKLLSKGNGRKFFTYMSCKVPIIGPKFYNISDTVRKSKCGILVDTSNPKEIAESIIYLLEHPEEAKAMGERGRKAIEEKYNWEIEKKKLLKVYQRLGGNHK